MGFSSTHMLASLVLSQQVMFKKRGDKVKHVNYSCAGKKWRHSRLVRIINSDLYLESQVQFTLIVISALFSIYVGATQKKVCTSVLVREVIGTSEIM